MHRPQIDHPPYEMSPPYFEVVLDSSLPFIAPTYMYICMAFPPIWIGLENNERKPTCTESDNYDFISTNTHTHTQMYYTLLYYCCAHYRCRGPHNPLLLPRFRVHGAGKTKGTYMALVLGEEETEHQINAPSPTDDRPSSLLGRIMIVRLNFGF